MLGTSRSLLALLAISALAADESSAPEIVAPDGFVLQRLDVADGLIARPNDWHYATHAWQQVGSGEGARVWYVAPVVPDAERMETGLEIELYVGAAKSADKSTEVLARDFLAQRTRRALLVGDCGPIHLSHFIGECREVIETLTIAHESKAYHIRYSEYWSPTADMIVSVAFVAPVERWEAVRPIADVMRTFQLFGPNQTMFSAQDGSGSNDGRR